MLNNLVGGFNPSEQYESQLGLLFPIYGKKVPNHQPVILSPLINQAPETDFKNTWPGSPVPQVLEVEY